MESLILPFLGKELLSKAFSETSLGIYSGLEELKKYNHYDFEKLIIQLDLELKIQIIESYIKYIEENIHNETIKLNVDSILSIIKKINIEITDINSEIIYHKTKWLNSMRNPNIKSKIDNLINHSILFDKRIDLLLKFNFNSK